MIIDFLLFQNNICKLSESSNQYPSGKRIPSKISLLYTFAQKNPSSIPSGIGISFISSEEGLLLYLPFGYIYLNPPSTISASYSYALSNSALIPFGSISSSESRNIKYLPVAKSIPVFLAPE